MPWGVGILPSVSDAGLGQSPNREDQKVLDAAVWTTSEAVLEAATAYVTRVLGWMDEEPARSWVIPIDTLKDGQPHIVAEGMGKTLLQYQPDKDSWLVWRNDEPVEEFRSLQEAAEKTGWLVDIVEARRWLRRRFVERLMGKLRERLHLDGD